MKELEQEVRKSAMWRVWGFWIFVSALCITYLLSMHGLYASTGDKEWETTKQQIEQEKNAWLEEKKKLQKLKTDLAQQVTSCEENNDPEKLLADCEGKIKIVEVDIEDFDRKLQHCKGDLRAAQMNN